MENNNSTAPIISIIVPVYNVEKYLPRCLDSIVAQTFTDWECILIDDGSPDKSGHICDEYAEKDGRFKVIHQENKGVSAARNAGLDAAKGEWIGFVDSDDWVEPTMYESLYKKTSCPDIDIVTCDCFLEYNFNTEIKKIFTSTNRFENMEKLVSSERQGWLWVCIFRNNVLKKNNVKFPREICILEDVIFQMYFFLYANSAAYLQIPLYHYNLVNDNSATYSLSQEKVCHIIQANETIRNFIQTNKMDFFENALKLRFVKSKCWILKKANKVTSEIASLWNEERLLKVDRLTFNQRIILWSAENRFIILIILLRKLNSFVRGKK